MKTIVYKERHIQVPENWHEIPFQNFNNASKNNETELLFMASLLGLSAMYLRNVLPFEKLKEIRKCLEFTKTLPNPEPILAFESRGVKYNLHKTYNEMTFGQYIDIDGRTFEKEGMDGIPYVMAILFFAENEKSYTEVIPKITKRAEEFQELSCMIVIGIANFFLLLSNQSLLNFQKFLKKAKGNLVRLEAEVASYLRNTGGQVSPIELRMIDSLKLKQSQINQFLKY